MDLVYCDIFDAATKLPAKGITETNILVSIFYNEEKWFLAIIGWHVEKQFATLDEATAFLRSHGFAL